MLTMKHTKPQRSMGSSVKLVTPYSTTKRNPEIVGHALTRSNLALKKQ